MRGIFIFVLVLVTGITLAQKLDDQLVRQAKDLNEKLSDATVSKLHSTSTYKFYLDRKNSQLHVENQEAERYLALRSNAGYVKRNFYNNNSYIEDYSIKSERGKDWDHNKICGHYQSGDIFYSDAQLCAYKFNFDFQGRAVDVTTKTIYTDPKYLTYVFFHDDLFTGERKIVFEIPNYADIELVEINFENYNIKKQVVKGETTMYSYSLSDAEAMSTEPDAPGYLHYLPHILILTKSYVADSKKITVLSSTKDLYAWYNTLTAEISHDIQQEIKDKVRDLTAGLVSDVDKIAAIYYWVQDNIKYIAFENGLAAFKPEDASKVYYNKYGDCKGMANLSKEMLKLAGFDARLTWIGTDKIPYTYDLPTLAVDNHMICTVYINGETIIIDPTEKNNPLGYHAERIQGKQILIENGESYLLDIVKKEPIENYLKESKWVYEIEDGHLSGTGISKVNGEYKKTILNYLTNLTKEDIDDFLKSVVGGGNNPDQFQIESFSEFDRSAPLTIAYDMQLDNHVNTFEKDIYLDMDFYEEFKNRSMKEDRKIPFSFGTKAFNRTVAELQIPAGYTVNYLPAPYQVKNEYFSFDLKYEEKNKKIIYSKEIKILQNTLPIAAFSQWNDTVDHLNKFYNDQIILKTNE